MKVSFSSIYLNLNVDSVEVLLIVSYIFICIIRNIQEFAKL